MSFKSTKVFRVSFVWKGKNMWEIIPAWSSMAARMIIEQRYPGASGIFLYEET